MTRGTRKLNAAAFTQITLALLVGAGALGGCARRAAQAGSTSPEASAALQASGAAAAYYPLAVGNRWTYRVEFLGQKSERTVEIKAVEGGYYVDTAGGRLRADAQGVRDEARYLLQEPLREGSTWTSVLSADSTERYKIVKAGRECAAPAGTFDDCVTVESSNRVNPETTLYNRVTFARGVGIVRLEVTAERQGQRTRQAEMALTSYEVR